MSVSKPEAAPESQKESAGLRLSTSGGTAQRFENALEAGPEPLADADQVFEVGITTVDRVARSGEFEVTTERQGFRLSRCRAARFFATLRK